MAIKTTLDFAAPAKKRVYPYLGVHNDLQHGELIILFNTQRTGTVLSASNKSMTVGTYWNQWDEDEFLVLQHRVILENL